MPSLKGERLVDCLSTALDDLVDAAKRVVAAEAALQAQRGSNAERIVPFRGLLVAARNTLKSLGVQTVGDLRKLSFGDLMAVKGCGPTTADQILRRFGDIAPNLRPKTCSPKRIREGRA